MQKTDSMLAVYRILDANANRLREGLRVVEEYYRFVEGDARITRRFKALRHSLAQALAGLDRKKLLRSRDSQGDQGRKTMVTESNRDSLFSVVQASFMRCQEAARVLEEYGKLVHAVTGEEWKELRFSLYELEKKLILKGNNGKQRTPKQKK